MACLGGRCAYRVWFVAVIGFIIFATVGALLLAGFVFMSKSRFVSATIVTFVWLTAIHGASFIAAGEFFAII